MRAAPASFPVGKGYFESCPLSNHPGRERHSNSHQLEDLAVFPDTYRQISSDSSEKTPIFRIGSERIVV